MFSNLFLIFRYQKKTDEFNLCIKAIDDFDQMHSNLKKSILEREYRRVESENISLSKDLLLKDLNGNELKLSDRINDSLLMVYRFTGLNCRSVWTQS
jgi:hypothetical protein